MDVRWFDKSKFGLNQWVVDTVHLWGESPEGLWSIVFYDTVSYFVAELSYSSDVQIEYYKLKNARTCTTSVVYCLFTLANQTEILASTNTDKGSLFS